MCGIVGVAGKIGNQEEKIFRHLLIFDTVRGEHSTGIASVDRDGEVEVAKCVGDPFQLFDTSASDKIFRKQNRVLIGHNRYATTGKVNRRNAHPFEFDGLVGVHNGTLTNKWNIPNGKDFEVDSEAMYNHINDVGIEKAMPEIQGAWALSYYNKDDATLNFLRNKDRPMHMILSKDGKTLFWASEAWMLTVALSREKYAYGSIVELPEDTLYTYNIALAKNMGDMPEFEKPRAKRVVGKAANVSYLPPVYGKQLPAVAQQAPLPKPAIAVKKGAVPSAMQGIDENLLGKTDILLELVSLQEDDKGGKYVVCHDPFNPSADIRVYYHENDIVRKKVGKMITGSISSAAPQANSQSRWYYKVSPWTITYRVEEAQDDLFIPRDKSGIGIPKAEFEKKYSICSWCNSDIQYGDQCRIGEGSDVLCQDCMKDEELTQYMPTSKVYN